MTHFINHIIKGKDEVEASRLVSLLQKINHAPLGPLELERLFHRGQKLYARYSREFSKALVDYDNHREYAGVDFYFHMFCHSSVICSLVLSRRGAYEAEREVLDYFTSCMRPEFKIPDYIAAFFNNANSENALRLAAILSDAIVPENSQSTPQTTAAMQGDEPVQASDANNSKYIAQLQRDFYLQMVQNHVYTQVELARPEKIGEIALLHFLQGNIPRAHDYLQMQLGRYSGDLQKLVTTEITHNRALFERSATARSYKAWVEEFVQEKQKEAKGKKEPENMSEDNSRSVKPN